MCAPWLRSRPPHLAHLVLTKKPAMASQGCISAVVAAASAGLPEFFDGRVALLNRLDAPLSIGSANLCNHGCKHGATATCRPGCGFLTCSSWQIPTGPAGCRFPCPASRRPARGLATGPPCDAAAKPSFRAAAGTVAGATRHSSVVRCWTHQS